MRLIFTGLIALFISMNGIAQNTSSLFLSDSTFARDAINSVAYDAAGNKYVVGMFAGIMQLSGNQFISDFSASDDGLPTSPIKGFVSKYSNAGVLLWTKTFMGRGSQFCLDVEVNKTNGDCYVSGNFTTELLLDGVRQDSTDGNTLRRPFIAKFDANGNKQWINTTMSSVYTLGSFSIALSPDGENLYWHCDFNKDLQINGTTVFAYEGQRYVLMRINTSNGAIIKNFEASDYLQDGFMLNCDNRGNIYWSGIQRDSGYAVRNPQDGTNQGFILKFDSSLVDPLWAFEVSGKQEQTINATAVDASGNVYIYGTFNDSTRFFRKDSVDQGVLLLPVANKINGYIAKVSRNGNLIWAKQFSGDQLIINDPNELDLEIPLTVDSRNNVYFGGTFGGLFGGVINFQNDSLQNFTSHGEPFLIKLSSSGALSWMIKPETLRGGRIRGLAAFTNKVMAVGELTGIYNFFQDNYFKYQSDSIHTDYNAQFLWEVADCDILIRTAATSNTVNTANPVTLSVPNLPGTTYQWIRNGNSINGAATHTLITPRGGNYFCVLTNGPCQINSNTKRITYVPQPFAEVGEAAVASNNGGTLISIYPNPADKWFILNIPSGKRIENYQVAITDVNGRMLLNTNVASGKQIIQLPSGILPGTYMLKVIGEDLSTTLKLLVQ